MTQEQKRLLLIGDPLDTKTGQLDDLLSDKLEEALHTQTGTVLVHELVKIAAQHDPIDLSIAADRLPSSSRAILFQHLPDDQARITFLIHSGNNTRTAIFRQLSDEQIILLLEKMPPDDAVWMLDNMSTRLSKRILEKMNPKKAHQIRELGKHEKDTAGRLMTNDFFAFSLNQTIGDVAAKIRSHPGTDLHRVFVLNEYDELIGYVPDRNLIVNPPTVLLRQVMRPIQHTATVFTSRDEVVEMMERYQLPALPVIDEYDQLIGVISFEDVVEAMHDIIDETIASIAGTGEDIREGDPIIKRFFWRAPWLVVTLLAGLLTATFMSLFKTSSWFLFVPFFVPLIAGMSGNVGIQCSTLIVRSISSGELTIGTRRETIIKELSIGLLIGVFFGLLCGLIVLLLDYYGLNPLDGSFAYQPIAIASIVCLGLCVACLNAAFLGTFSPFLFARLRIDPAIASGPIVTAFNDVTSTLMFFLVARTVSRFFV